jgi:phenylacetic acid degradation operon negative regulatory protein
LSAETDWSDERSIPAVFTFSAAVLRFLRNDPLLPSRLAPDDWPLDELRVRYDQFERSTQTLLRTFLGTA